MAHPQRDHGNRHLTRRAFLGIMAVTASGVLAGCSTMRLVLHAYPDRFDRDPALRQAMLTAFVRTVVPDAPADQPYLTRVFDDDFYPFHEYCGFFLSDLADTTRDLFGHDDFVGLDLRDRTRVVASGLERGGPAGRLYTGAVFMAQYSFYAGIYDDARGCPLIDFPGANDGFEPNTLTVAEIERLLAREQTADGNPV